MEELFALCDTITVLRDGRHVSTGAIAETTPSIVVRQMIGRELRPMAAVHIAKELGPVRLKVDNLTSPGKFSQINLTVSAGEIVGLAGLVGAGRSEVVQAIFGLDPSATGEVHVNSQAVTLRSVECALAAGVEPRARGS